LRKRGRPKDSELLTLLDRLDLCGIYSTSAVFSDRSIGEDEISAGMNHFSVGLIVGVASTFGDRTGGCIG
jgi:hypothetical protein